MYSCDMNEPIEGNPRQFFGRRHKERGPCKYAFAAADFAEFLGMKEPALRKAIQRKQVDLNSLASVFAYARNRAAREQD